MSETAASKESDHSIPTTPGDPENVTILPEPDLGSAFNEKSNVKQPSRRDWMLTCIGLYLGALLYGLDTTIAATVQASIYEDLGSLQKLPWVGIGFPLGSVAVVLLVGKLFQTFEIKWLNIGSVLLFEIGSAICGAAPTADAVIVGRVIAGIGGSGMYIGALSYVSIFVPRTQLPLYNAGIGLCWGAGAIIGPAIGGAFSDSSATWRWAFYINLPLAAVVAPVYIFFPRHNPQSQSSAADKFKRIDWIGAFLHASTFVLFVLILAFQGSTWAWNAPGAIVLWVLFGLSLVSYATQQYFCIFTDSRRRLFPVEFLKSRSMLLLFFTTAASASAVAVTLYYIPLFFQFTKGDTALQACVRLLPFILPYVFSIMLSGGLLPVFGLYAPWYLLAGILMLVGGVLMFLVSTTTKTAAYYGFEILIAVGAGLVFQTGYAIAAAKVPRSEIASSIGFINVAQIGSISLALAIAGSIYQNLGYVKLHDALAGYRFSESELRSVLAGSKSAIFQRGDARVQELAISAVVDTMSETYALVIAAGAITLTSFCSMKWEKLNLEPTAGG